MAILFRVVFQSADLVVSRADRQRQLVAETGLTRGMRVNNRFALISTVCLVVQGCANDIRSQFSSESEVITTQLIEIYNITYSGLSTDEMADGHLRFFAETPTILPPDQAAIVGRNPVADFYYGGYQEGNG